MSGTPVFVMGITEDERFLRIAKGYDPRVQVVSDLSEIKLDEIYDYVPLMPLYEVKQRILAGRNKQS